jgi:hypothetical protein
MGLAPKVFSKEDVLRAMRHTRSNRAASRYLGCSYQHYKRYAKLYNDDETGKTLFDSHLNRQGKGIPKHLKGSKKEPALDSILNGTLDPSHFTPDKIKQRLIFESKLPEECARCKMHERRITDYKIPLLLNFKNGNKKHYIFDNLELLCYNCYFLYVADPFTPEQINIIEDFHTDKFKVEKPTWELDDDLLANMRELGLD